MIAEDVKYYHVKDNSHDPNLPQQDELEAGLADLVKQGYEIQSAVSAVGTMLDIHYVLVKIGSSQAVHVANENKEG